MKKGLILLLCSDPVLRLVMQEVLDHAGYVVQPAGDLGVAVNRLNESPVDLLVVVPYIDNITGHDAALYLRTRQHGLPVLMVSSMLKDDRLQYRAELQALEIFPEPYSAAQFVQKVEEVLAKKHPPR